ncbi:hypothetical protein EYF80_042691 [Liparis tanakae]|uniref:Uncharacterized protein n=1 Tax=Liparis tanakae TaxID=230148 RepID=A0A4Z2G204_9TELE|nr:hypothetical protein EYF80_042691 [Liparis tanakae]
MKGLMTVENLASSDGVTVASGVKRSRGPKHQHINTQGLRETLKVWLGGANKRRFTASHKVEGPTCDAQANTEAALMHRNTLYTTWQPDR